MRAWLAATVAVVACGKGSTPSGNGSAAEAPAPIAAIATPNGWGSAWVSIANPSTVERLGCTYASDGNAIAMKLQPPGGSGAVSLPSELGRLVALHELCVEHGGLTELPVELTALAHLSKLDVADNRLRALPDLRKLPITALELDGNPDLDLAHVAWPTTLERLAIAKSKLAALPPHLEALPALAHLDVPDNQLTEIPEALWSAPALGSIDLSRNPIHRLPGIEQAKALQSVVVVGVPLDPDEIDRLQSLGKSFIGLGNPQTLDDALKDPAHAYRVVIAHREHAAPLTKLPAAIGTLVNLRELVIDGERLTSLPPELGKLVHLRLLSVRGNALTTIAPAIFTLPALEILRLDNNAITVLPDDIGKLAGLRELSIARNALTALPAALGSSAKLEMVDADANQLATVPAELVNAHALRELFLWNNRLTSLPPNLGDTVAIFDVRMNPLHDKLSEHGGMLAPLITYDEDSGPALPYRVTKPVSLDDRTRVAAIGADDLAAFVDRMSADKLRTLKIGEPGRVTGIAIVRLHKLPDELAQLVNLGELDLSYTELRALPRWLRDLKYLRRLDISGSAALSPAPWLVYQLAATTVVDDCHDPIDNIAELQPLLQMKLGKTPAAVVAERHCPTKNAGASWKLVLETEANSDTLATLDDHGVLKLKDQSSVTLATPELDWRSAVTWKRQGASIAIAVTTATGPASIAIDVK